MTNINKKIINLHGSSKDHFEEEILQLILDQQNEIDTLKKLIIKALQKDYPDEIIKFADILDH